MKMRVAKTNQAGFSLVELMVVVGIISILATMALPRFRVFQAKSKQSEGKANLGYLWTLQESYFSNEGAYSTLTKMGGGTPCAANPIGFQLSDCTKSLYSYEVGAANSDSYSATASSSKVWPGCTDIDLMTITEKKELNHSSDVTKTCT